MHVYPQMSNGSHQAAGKALMPVTLAAYGEEKKIPPS